MKRHLSEVLESIVKECGGNILAGARHYLEVDIGKRAEVLGYPELKEKYGRVYAIVPLKHPRTGMKVRIDGRTSVRAMLSMIPESRCPVYGRRGRTAI
jgi:hypothetical protein